MHSVDNKSFLKDRVSINDNGCWIWGLNIDRDGYGKFTRPKISSYAHRASYKIFKGFIPENYDVDHICWNPSCCNPDHLRLLPKVVNRRFQRSSFHAHCKNGHKMAGRNVVFHGGRKVCRSCVNQRARDYAERKKNQIA